jgi:hypothetical protein
MMIRTILILVATAALTATGCTTPATAPQQTWAPPKPTYQPAQEAVFLPKVAETESPLPTAVETTLLLQEKYSRSLEDLQRERDHNRNLSEDKQRLVENVNKLQVELAKTQQELTEANTLLVQVRQELEKWKNDVLGFRDEMRQANRSQIDALAKVMNLLGAEPSPPSAETAAKKPTVSELPVKAAPATSAEPKKIPAPPMVQAPATSPQASTNAKEEVANAPRR